MSLRVLWALFFATGIAILGIVLIVLVVGLNCLQIVTPLKVFGVSVCDYGLTSSDFRVKAGGTTVLLLFLVLVFSPILATFGQPRLVRRSKGSP